MARGRRSGRASPTRSARRGTAKASTSRYSASTLPAWNSVSSTGPTRPRRSSRSRSASAPISYGTATCLTSAQGQLYGYRVHGPYLPEQGLRFNPAKLVIDPYARALAGELEWKGEVFGYHVGDPSGDLTRDDRDSAAFVPKSVVVDPSFDWEGDEPPRTPWHRSILYEVHVKGFTIRHPEVPEKVRGTYAGLGSPAALGYLTGLGITAVELLPVHHYVDEAGLVQRGLRNYWGYNSIAFFATTRAMPRAKCPGRPCVSSRRW